MDNKLAAIDPQLYREALTHSSLGEELHNQRLEFLGDAVLSMIISEWLFLCADSFSEGRMSQIRAALVREETLAIIAARLDLGGKVRLSKGEEKSGGRRRASLLADTLEAVLASMYLTLGWDQTRDFVLDLFGNLLSQACQGRHVQDYKSELQEIMQAQGIETLDYTVVKETGPPHARTFWIELAVDGKVLATGRGKTKKQGEQEAARQALANRHSD